MSKLGPSQGSRIVAFLTILGSSKLSFTQPNDDVLQQILVLALEGALSTIYAFTNTHSLIKSCLNEDLLLVYVLFNETDGFCNETHRFYAGF